jgi:murein DD-endopeptidase MepM/ murein hydrolase activator NlpD
VTSGSTVEAGSLIGFLGTVPFEKTDISHLHFEIIYNGKNTDPLEIMGR